MRKRIEQLLATVLAVTAMGAAGCSKDDPVIEPIVSGESQLVVPPLDQFVVLARHGAQFADRAFIMDGNVGIARSSTSTQNILSAAVDSRTATGKVSLAQRIVLGERAGIGNVGADRIDAPASAMIGTRAPFMDPPVAPQPGTFTAGT